MVPARAALPIVWAMLGTFVVTFDFFAVNVTVPTLRDALGADAAQLQWIVAAFGLLYGSGLIAGARLGERHGVERLFGLGLALFALASAAAAAAPDLAWLIAARAAQGVAAALLTPQVLAMAGQRARRGAAPACLRGLWRGARLWRRRSGRCSARRSSS